eukprot:1073535-Pelagomonas_calceolata.AAC.2
MSVSPGPHPKFCPPALPVFDMFPQAMADEQREDLKIMGRSYTIAFNAEMEKPGRVISEKVGPSMQRWRNLAARGLSGRCLFCGLLIIWIRGNRICLAWSK